jgi:hypothetical protein
MAMGWQERALRVVDLIPELDYVSRFYARMLKQLRLYPAEMKPDGTLDEIKSGPPVEVLQRIRDAGGGHTRILSNYGKLMFITGEGNLFGYDLNTDEEVWTFVWNSELKIERNRDDSIKKVIWTPADTANPREFDGEQAVVYKFWTSHSRATGEATSPMRAIVEGLIAEELIALTRSVRSTAVSRAIHGILIIPQEIQPPPAGDEGDEDPDISPWISLIAEHLEAQVEQAGSAAAAAPYLMEVPFDYVEGIRMVQLHDPQHDYMESALRKEAIERIARGVDFPPEALLGIGSTNHWAALQILMDMWRSHGAPIAQDFCDDLTAVYLRPALKDPELEYENWRNVVVTYDESKVTVKPDRSDDARTALTLGAIGWTGFRKMLNIQEEYAASEEELEEMKEFRARGSSSSAPEPDTSQNGPEPPGPEGDSGRRTRVTSSAGSNGKGMQVMDLALMRCRELAGIRIKQKAQRHFPERIELIESIPLCDVAAVLGQETLKEMGLANSIWLVTGGADNLRSLLAARGYHKEQADLFGQAVEAQAAFTLYEIEFPDVDFSALVEQFEVAA